MYTLTIDSGKVMRDSDGVVFNCADGLLMYEEYKLWLADGNTPNPLPATEQFKLIERAVEKHMDEVAQADGWDNRWTCVARAGYINPWQSKGIKFAQWMDACWMVAIQAQNDVVAGLRTIPTPEEAVLELPVMVW